MLAGIRLMVYLYHTETWKIQEVTVSQVGKHDVIFSKSLKGSGVGQYTKDPYSTHWIPWICHRTSKEALTGTLQRRLKWGTLIAGYKECD